jgi:hypothetical protein
VGAESTDVLACDVSLLTVRKWNREQEWFNTR